MIIVLKVVILGSRCQGFIMNCRRKKKIKNISLGFRVVRVGNGRVWLDIAKVWSKIGFKLGWVWL